MSNIIGLCLDDVIEEIKAYTDEGVSRSEAIEYEENNHERPRYTGQR